MSNQRSGEKRRYTRVSFASETRLVRGTTAMACHLVDISIKGALVEFDGATSIKPGDKYRLELYLDGDDAVIFMDLRVAHVTGQRVGLYCEAIDADSMAHLRRLMELNLGDADLVNRELAQLGH